MQIIINDKILSIPPYISTSWKAVISLHITQENEKQVLVVSLNTGVIIKIPGLGQDLLTKVFQTHSQVVSSQTEKPRKAPGEALNLFNMDQMMTMGFPMRIAGGALEGLGAAMQHNSEQSDAADLPKEVLEKIAAVAKIMGNDESVMQSLKFEPHCNCIHCQIARAIKGETRQEENLEEEVSDDDLKFKTWDITQSGDKLYTVSNPLDQKEQYSVYLGQPIGCTCGQKNCDHIKAVLNT